MLRHPIKDGKPSAKVLSRLGDDQTPGVENQYCAARAGLAEAWTEKSAQPLIDAASAQNPLEDSSRLDLTGLSFVSIDAARTVDIDDALHAKSLPTVGSSRLQSLTPPLISQAWRTCRVCSPSAAPRFTFMATSPRCCPKRFAGPLRAGRGHPRPAIVCQMQVLDSGEIESFAFHRAVVRSRAKLAYAAVDRYVTGNSDDLIAHANPLEALVQVYRTLRERRSNASW
ncbi:MAG: hypothetical protein CM15mP89_3300 [Gammaproteobacteria bacterium]|nr:MAG: hypothetical protein CM15mP89_3300 [Gammaproteobacteria bacterium]